MFGTSENDNTYLNNANQPPGVILAVPVAVVTVTSISGLIGVPGVRGQIFSISLMFVRCVIE